MNKKDLIFGIIIVVSVLINVILGLVLANNNFGSVNWLRHSKEIKLESKINRRFKDLNWYLRKDKFDEFYNKLSKEYKPVFSKKVFGNRNFPVVIKEVPVVKLDKHNMMKVLQLYKYIEEEHNQIYYRTNYIRE